MKELSIEEKAKRYDVAIERAKEFYILCKKCGAKDTIDFLEDSFPELKESEDERIKKGIIKSIMDLNNNWLELHGVTKENAIAWLEKQVEQKLADKYNIRGIKSKHAEGKLGEMIKEMKSADKVEPKFHKGDWIVHLGTENIYQVVAIIDNQYQLKYGDNYTVQKCTDVDKSARLWNVSDAKDGDVLVLNDEVFIYAHRKQLYSIAVAHCFVDSAGGFRFDGEFGYTEKGNSIHPATKEQRDTLMKTMSDAGYKWNAENKQLRKIEPKHAAWSEEDEDKLKSILFHIEDVENKDVINWLKSLKDRVQPQPKQEWSEEDEEMLNLIIARLHSHRNVDSEEYDKEYNWLNYNLKSLRPHKQWKPTEEQMKALNDINLTGGISYPGQGQELINLYNDLKKHLENKL